MFHRAQIWLSITFCLGLAAIGIAADATKSSTREGVPLTRDDMKRALDASKESVPRLPLPPVTPEEEKLIAEQKQQAAQGEAPRRYGLANNGRMRAFYLPEYGFVRTRDIERARTPQGGVQDLSAGAGHPLSFRSMAGRASRVVYDASASAVRWSRRFDSTEASSGYRNSGRHSLRQPVHVTHHCSQIVAVER